MPGVWYVRGPGATLRLLGSLISTNLPNLAQIARAFVPSTPKMKSFIGLLLGLVGSAVAADTPAAPGLTYLYSLNCTLGQALPVGAGPHGTRTVIPITGGSFSGPRLSGTLL